MIKVVSFTICPFVQRVTAALEARSLPYDIEYISLSNPPEWFLAVSPNAQVPLLITDNDTVLFESDAIVEYLDDAYGPIVEGITPEQRAIDRAWSYQASKHYLVQCGAMRSPTAEALTSRTEDLQQAFSRAEKQLGKGRYFNGDTLGNVDIAWLPLLHRAKIVEQHAGYDFVRAYPKVKAWQTAMLATGLAERSVSYDFNEAFAAFYLSEKTYLGRGENCAKPVGIGNEGTASSCCD